MTWIPVADDDLADLRSRVRRTRWSPDWPGATWEHGVDAATLRELAARWADDFDWRASERRIAGLPFHRVDLDGTPVSFLLFRGEGPSPTPLLLSNGWPSTALELIPLARRLAEPAAHGDPAGRSFTVVVPALPGFPFSPQRPTPRSDVHELWHRLMTSLGFERYAAHGGDLGAGITSRLAQAHPDAVSGIHLLAVAAPEDRPGPPLTEAERRHERRVAEWVELEGSYEHQQRRRPLTLAPALSDSPVGLLAWILEKHRDWSDCGGDVFTRFTPEYLLETASLYWFSNAISTSFRPYSEAALGLVPPITRVETPTAVAVFPHDLQQPPREWAERTYAVSRYTVMPRGGHFAPHEEPELLAADIRAALPPR